ncbi:MAG: hypothetical protein K6G73_12175 [Marinilabiliaceae bacterium]|nr:hypothetical protein [Marinilabiliaceae bacterium]
MSKYISLSRLRMLFRHDLTSYAKEKVMVAALIFVPTFLAYFISEHVMWLTVLLLFISLFTALFAPFYLASHICANMRTKQDAIQFAMLPATNVEKFLVRFVDYAFLPTVIVILAVIAIGLVTGFLYSLGHFDKLVEAIAYLKGNWNEDLIVALNTLYEHLFTFQVLSFILLAFISYGFDISIAVLGGCIFKRFALVKTWLCYLLIAVTCGSFFSGAFVHHFEGIFVNFSDNSDVFLREVWIQIGILSALIVAALYGSYTLFKRKQIL